MAEIEEDLKSFSMQVKEESKKAVLKLSIQKLCHGSGSVTSWPIDGAQENRACYCFHCFICHELMGPDAMILIF